MNLESLEKVIKENKDKGLSFEEWKEILINFCEELKSRDECDAYKISLIYNGDEFNIGVVSASYFANMVIYKFEC